MNDIPIAQIAISTIKGSDKQNVHPKTIDKAIYTTDINGNQQTLDEVLIKCVKINGVPVQVNNNTVDILIPIIGDIETQESQEDDGFNVVTIVMTDGTEYYFSVKNGSTGKSAYQSYLDTTTDDPPLSETEWIYSLHGADGVILPGEYTSYIADNLNTNDSEKVLSARQGKVLKEMIENPDIVAGLVNTSVEDIPVEIIDPNVVIFNDPIAEGIALENWDLNQDGKITLDEAAAVTTFGTLFKGKNIVTTEWMQYFPNVSSIASQGFQQCLSLATTVIPANITTINSMAFNGNTACTSLTLEEGVTTIKSQAFKNNAFSSLVIPSTVTSIEWGAFDMASLTTVTCKATTPPASNSTTYKIFKTNDTITAIYVPAASVDAYKTNQYWSPWASVIQAIPTT